MREKRLFRIAIADEDKIYTSIISDILNKYQTGRPSLPVSFCIDTYNNSSSFASAAAETRYDLYILDISEEDTWGLDTAEKIRGTDCVSNIIFISRSDKYYKKAYELQAIQYLKKPVRESMLTDCLDRIFKLHKSFVSIKDGKNRVEIPADDIIYCISDGHYKRIVTIDRDYLVRMTMDEVKDILTESFFQKAGSGLIINMKYCREVSPGSILMSNNDKLKIPAGMDKKIGSEINKYLF
ncbi:MAG: LytTR family DNA-binding domain-containing protein [Lachnospiraceae bacterium]|jgi:DNA-binding LytR/AlgR family response regulator|nr:LytTR family DNA-binding domain-containing protein [Lachnospiraceae bacterium]MEE3461564.1 LytTR family DNA-binding domain-containing protein [Lachnospiraceae bacterium]